MRLLSKGDELCLNPQTLRNNWVWWHMPETPVLVVGGGRQADPLCSLVSQCHQNSKLQVYWKTLTTKVGSCRGRNLVSTLASLWNFTSSGHDSQYVGRCWWASLLPLAHFYAQTHSFRDAFTLVQLCFIVVETIRVSYHICVFYHFFLSV